MKSILVALLPCVVAALVAQAGEPEKLNEQSLRKAQIFAEEGHLKAGLLLLFRVLREAKEPELREAARAQLNGMGLTPQEILKSDPKDPKAEDLAKIVNRLNNDGRLRGRLDTDVQYATQLLRMSAVPYLGADDQIHIDFKPKDAARGLAMLLEISFTENGGQSCNDALVRLELLCITGNKVEIAKKAVAEGKLPPDFEKDLAAATCTERLGQLMEALSNAPEAEMEQIWRRQAMQDLGLKLFKYLKTASPDAEIVKKAQNIMDFWTGQTHKPVNQDF